MHELRQLLGNKTRVVLDPKTDSTINGYLKLMPRVRSIVDCGTRCLEETNCDSWAFKKEDGRCFLQVEEWAGETGSIAGVEVFQARGKKKVWGPFTPQIILAVVGSWC